MTNKDSAFSWVVLMSMFMSQCILGGICLNGGLFYIILRNSLNSGAVETSWLCSLPVSFWCYASPVGSILTNRYGYRKCAFVGGLLSALGITAGYFSTSLPALFVTYGFLTGFGFGISYTGGMAALNAHFSKYKTIALGIVSIGHNVGQVMFATLIIGLENEYGWRGMMLMCGAIAFNMCVFALLMFPVDSDNVAQSDVSSIDVKENETSENKRKHFNLSILRKTSFLFFCFSNLFINSGQGIYILHLPSYSGRAGFDESDISLLWLSYGISNTIGKFFFSFLGHHPKVNTTIVYMFSLIITGVCMGVTPLFLTEAGFFVTAAFVGFFYGVTGALVQVVIYEIVGYNRFADGIGVALPFKGTGNLIGGPVAGILYAETGTYAASFYLAGVTMALGSFFLIVPAIHIRRRAKSKPLNNMFTVHEKNIEPSKLDTMPFISSESQNSHQLSTDIDSQQEIIVFVPSHDKICDNPLRVSGVNISHK